MYYLQGVIFSISYASDCECLLSCSDDRSVRVWKIADPTNWKNTDIKECLAVYGHPARVWRVIPSSKGFISIGEVGF
jgi:WD40 repeat protein